MKFIIFVILALATQSLAQFNGTCNGVAYNSPSVCSGKGNCIGLNNCNCTTGYFGHVCEAFNCGGQLFNATGTVCGGKGVCAAPDTCVCAAGITGTNCELFATPQKCRTVKYVTDGMACTNAAFPRMNLNETLACTQSLTCDPFTGTCRPIPAFGTACTADSNCTSTLFPLDSVSLKCINNKCSYKKHAGLSCTNGLDCRTGICSNSTCVGMPLGGACSSHLQCQDFGNATQLYCNNGQCASKLGVGAACVAGQCAAGLDCTGGKCVTTGAVDGAACNPTNANACKYKGAVSTGLSCYPTGATTGTCGYPGKGVQDSSCIVGAQCGAAFGCMGGKCVDAATVDCLSTQLVATTDPAVNCGSGLCDCPAGNFAVGKCSKNTQRATASACVNTLGPLVQCLIAQCPGDLNSLNPFDYSNNCAAKCLTTAVPYVCCLEKAFGANFVKPSSQALPYTCTAPTQKPTPQPTGVNPTTQPPTTKPPTSSATKAVASLFVVALTVMLF